MSLIYLIAGVRWASKKRPLSSRVCWEHLSHRIYYSLSQSVCHCANATGHNIATVNQLYHPSFQAAVLPSDSLSKRKSFQAAVNDSPSSQQSFHLTTTLPWKASSQEARLAAGVVKDGSTVRTAESRADHSGCLLFMMHCDHASLLAAPITPLLQDSSLQAQLTTLDDRLVPHWSGSTPPANVAGIICALLQLFSSRTTLNLSP
jgi:hypothetical protein